MPLNMLEFAQASFESKNDKKSFASKKTLSVQVVYYCLIYLSCDFQEFLYYIFVNVAELSARNYAASHARVLASVFEIKNSTYYDCNNNALKSITCNSERSITFASS